MEKVVKVVKTVEFYGFGTVVSTFLEETVTATRGNQKILPCSTGTVNAYSGVTAILTAGSQRIQYRAECYSGVYALPPDLVLLYTV